MLVLFEILQAVTNDRNWISTTPIFILIMIYIFCSRSWVWWDHVAWPVCTSSSVEGSRNKLTDEDNWGHPKMFHSLCYMWHAYKRNREAQKQASPSVSQCSVQWSAMQLSQEKSTMSQQWHCCEATSKQRTDLKIISGYRGWGCKCSKYW
jgi:hypothetical protein